MPKTRLNISLDQDLADFIKIYAQENRISVAEIFTQLLLALKRRSQGDPMEMILCNPDFHQALADVQARLRNGSAEWHTYEEVFER